MPLQVLPIRKFSVGKFGRKFVDIHQTKNYESQGFEVFLRERSNPVGQGPFGTEGLYQCLPSFHQNPASRPKWAIENGTDIPRSDCRGELGIKKLRDKYLGGINEESDQFLNSDPDKDFTSSDYDIKNSKHFGEEYSSTNQKNNYKIISGIEFSLAPDPYTDFNPRHGTTLKVYHSFSTEGGYDDPSIVTDQRNNKYINLASSNKRNPIFWLNSRVYLEIRHNLNSDDYMYIAENLDGWTKTKKKNSLVISKFISLNDNNTFHNVNDWYKDPISGPGIPRGKCSVLFLGDF